MDQIKPLFSYNGNKLIELCEKIEINNQFNDDYLLLYKIGVLYDLYNISENNISSTIKESLDKEISKLNSKKYRQSIKRLLESAFIFGLLDTSKINDINNNEEEINTIDKLKNKAYRIAISIYFYGMYLKDTGDINNAFFDNNIIIYRLFTRLGILTKARNENIENVDIFSIDIHGKIEAVNKEINNRFSVIELLNDNFPEKTKEKLSNISFENDETFFSDFQSNVINKLINKYQKGLGEYQGNSIAISAPTSAGKTFIIKKYIIFKIFESYLLEKNINIVFIVPSKALINELKSDFIELFKNYKIDNDICNIHSHISGEDFINDYFYKSNLFIFTQERLNHFYNDIKYKDNTNKIKFDIVVVDEAHKVGYGYRGTLLSYIITKIKKENNNIQLILLAPLLSKLQKFKEEFGLDSISECLSNFGLVGKNIIDVKISSNKNNNYKIIFYLRIGNDKIKLFTYNYILEEIYLKLLDNENKERELKGEKRKNFRFNSKEYLSLIPRFFNKLNTQSIIFRFGSESVINQAEILNSILENDNFIDSKLSNYLLDILPNDFSLNKFLKSKIAYHNGKLPISIKSSIENDFKSKNEVLIKYLCANHTVLEGVNLPAKNIFIGGRDLKNKILSELDIKNLVGRSGRLNEHLVGNVFFINSNSEEKIPNEYNHLSDLENNITNILIDDESGYSKFDRFLKYLEGANYKNIITYKDIYKEKKQKENEIKDFEYMTGYLISKYIDYSNKNNNTKKGEILSIGEIIEKNKENIIYNEVPDFIIKIGYFIYSDGNIKKEKLIKLNNHLNNIYKDIDNKSKGNADLFNIIKKNIFVDPRKQLDFYLDVEYGNNSFVKDNIGKYSDIFKLLINSKEIYKQVKTIGDKEYEKSITSKLIAIKDLLINIQKYFIHQYKDENSGRTYFSGNQFNDDNVLNIINQWISSLPLKSILGKKSKYYFRILEIINDEILFNYLNAFSIYFELANLGYKKYLDENYIINETENIVFDTNFTYFLELGSFYPNIVYLISKGVSRESAIWLKDNGIINYYSQYNDNSKIYFEIEKNRILNDLEKMNKHIIKEELKRFIY